MLQPIRSTLRLIISGSGYRYQNKRSAFNPRLSFNRSTDREPVGCTCTCRKIFTQHCSDHSFSFYLGTMEFVASLGNFSWLSSDCVSFSLLLLNLISTFHNQSKNRRQNSSYEKHNTSWYIFPFYLLFYNVFLISDCDINYTKLFYSNFWTVSHLFSLRKTLLYIPDSTNFLAELTAKQLTKQRGLQALLKGWKLGVKLMDQCGFWLDV